MAKGFDCATPLTYAKAKEFAGDGYSFVCRYLAKKSSWKALSVKEAQEISKTGLFIVSIFEDGAKNASYGEKQGHIDGALALEYAKAVKQPLGTPIYFTVDFDANSGDMDAIAAYLRAAQKACTSYECAVYGEKDVCEEMIKRNVVKRVWQTYAWSRGLKVKNPSIYQYKNDVVSHGIGIDLDESNGNAGGWKV